MGMKEPIQPQASHCDSDPSLLDLEQAREHILASIEPVSGTVFIPVREGLNRTLAQDIHSPFSVPGYTNSAMDGYALQGSDLPNEGSLALELIGDSFAGQPFHGEVGPGQCVRIMTGAQVPAGADTVVMQESTEASGDQVYIGPGHSSGQNIRSATEDLAAGETVVRAGTRLRPAELGLLASIGIAEIPVKRRPRVAFFSTGDELRSVGQPLDEGAIYDSNRYTIYGMLDRLDLELLDMGAIPDRPEELEKAFHMAAEIGDVVITSGGVSEGEADYVTRLLKELGQIHFWKVAIKPGRPMAFGSLREATFFGLPGNPVSVMANFYQLVQPGLLRLMGQDPKPNLRVQARCLSELRKKPGRTEFQRGILEWDAEGRLTVRSSGPQGSGVLHSMGEANCFIVLPKDSGTVSPESEVLVEPFHGLV